MASFLKDILLMALVISFPLNSVFQINAVNAAESSHIIQDMDCNILENKYDFFAPFSDGYKYEVFTKTKESFEERFFVYIRKFIPSGIKIEAKTDKDIDTILEIIEQYDDFKDTEALKIETSREQNSGFYNITIFEKEADEKIINPKTVENICNILSEKDLINSLVLYRAGYMDNECSWLPHNFYESQQERINQCIKENNLDDIISLVKVNDNTATPRYALMMNKNLKSDSLDYEYDLNEINEIYYSDDACELFNYFLKICYECKIGANLSKHLSGITVQEVDRIYEREVTCGDVNFDKIIDMSDLTELSLILLGDYKSDNYTNQSADIDGDNKITVADLARLKQYVSNQITSLR